MTSSALPFVSVLVPVKNEEQHVRKCIESLVLQDYPNELYEIIVMDNMSEDDTHKIVQAMGVSIHSSASTTIGRIRNELFGIAKGGIVAYIDGDCTAPPSWIRETVILLKDNEIGAVGGYVERPAISNWLVSGWALRKTAVERVTDRLATGSFFLRRDIFCSVGGFNESLSAGEDTDISRRIVEMNKKLMRVPSASVVHWGYPATIRSFLRRQIWQTSDYLLTRKAGFDAVFFAALSWVLMILGVFVTSFLALFELTIFLLAAIVLLPGALAWFRISKSSESLTPVNMLKVYAVSVLYLIGRGIGLSISMWKYLSGKYRNNKE